MNKRTQEAVVAVVGPRCYVQRVMYRMEAGVRSPLRSYLRCGNVFGGVRVKVWVVTVPWRLFRG